MTWLLLALAILCEVSATLALRASEGLRRKRWAPPMVVLYIASFTFLGQALAAGLPLGVAYGVWAASGVALTALLGRAIFQEPLTRTMLLGLALIGAGVLLVELGAAPS